MGSKSQGSAPGKIILSGEYAVAFGFPGIALPAPLTLDVMAEPSEACVVDWPEMEGNTPWEAYVRSILKQLDSPRARISIENAIPLGKGMGSSTALVIALTRALWKGSDAEKKQKARAIEDAVNPGHSGIDFTVIWEARPLVFERGKEPLPLTRDLSLYHGILIDTGTPDQTTAELVAWVKERSGQEAVRQALETIGRSTRDILQGTPLLPILRMHHQAQDALGVVPSHVQAWIALLESHGGAAKVIGAGSRTGGGGVILALHEDRSMVERLVLHQPGYRVLPCDVFGSFPAHA